MSLFYPSIQCKYSHKVSAVSPDLTSKKHFIPSATASHSIKNKTHQILKNLCKTEHQALTFVLIKIIATAVVTTPITNAPIAPCLA